MFARFSAASWERAYRRAAALAFSRVPFYRDQWVAAGRALDEPEPTPTAELAGQLHRLCPFAEPYDPAREPSLWIGEAAALREALALAGVPGRAPVLEVRPAVLDRRTLGRGGPRYGVLLGPGARVVHERRRRELNAAAVELATRAGRAVVVGERPALDALLPELAGAEVTAVERVTLGAAADGGALVHDPHLGYYAARASCGRIHLLWRRFHARPVGDAPAVSALRRRRPVLVGVVPDGRGTPGSCPEHGTPILGEAR